MNTLSAVDSDSAFTIERQYMDEKNIFSVMQRRCTCKKNIYSVIQRCCMNEKTILSLHKLRFKVFREKLGWDVPVLGEFEIDKYDALNPHFVLHMVKNEVKGCMRLLPTKGFYMLQDTFPELLRGEAAPSSESVVELSRFAVDSSSLNNSNNNACREAYSLLMNLYFYAKQHNIKRCVMVTTVAIERYLRRMGIDTKRFGDGCVTIIGKERTVALKMDLNEDFQKAIPTQYRWYCY